MKLQPQSLKKSLNKAYLKEKTNRSDIENFKANFIKLFDRINEQESEEHLKNIVADFFKDTWYKDKYEINTKDRKDLVIHTGKTAKEPVGVILEVKKPSNKAEMISIEKPNAKAMHELILYYLRERIELNNIDIKYLVITNIYEWYIIDANEFEKKIYRHPGIRRIFDVKNKDKKDNTFFYDEVQKLLKDFDEIIPCTYFDIREYEKTVRNNDKQDDNRLIALYKIFSPAHLLKQPFANDSNSLDTKFYTELLHLIGLEETKEGSKKLISQKKKPDAASLLENTIIKLEDKDCLRNIQNLTTFGNTKKEQLFNVALELCITWINRIMFLKLLEAQLSKYHKGNKDYLFLNTHIIFDFDELSNLFFQVLAERQNERRNHLKEKFSKVPYLNSSLFERTELERQTFDISALDNKLELPLHNTSILKNEQGKRRTGKLSLLQYLFEFLDAYDFTSEGAEEIQEENKNLINASVLGLIFEKINGYKDGSFFTPGFVTMYMCKETIRRAVVQKFNEAKEWHCKDLEELYDKIEDKKEANKIINNLKICDPAVGSGHFLVSALNEIIAIKSELKILLDLHGKTLRDNNLEVVNDELIVTDDDGKFFEYNSKSKESQRLQETLFHEKATIIENCLFGVDINPNSVKICRLRLWIELLKNAYYTNNSNYSELETLPNIDINIKCGNSLISRFALDVDIKNALGDSKWTIDTYRLAVQTYRQAESKEQKREMEELIEKIKKDFRSYISPNDPKFKKLSKLRGDLFNLSQTKELFDEGNKKTKETKKKIEDLSNEITKLETAIEEIKNNKIYENAFEWRFEFPEVLNDEGDFVGFDVVIGNPPYIPLENFNDTYRDFFRNKYPQFERKFETSVLFIVEGFKILKSKGLLSYIAPVTWQTGENYPTFRKYLFERRGIIKIINLPFNIFVDAYVETALYFFSKNTVDKYNIYSFDKKAYIDSLEKVNFSVIDQSLITAPKYKIILNPFVNEILNRLDKKFITLGEITISTQGLSGSRFKEVVRFNPVEDFPFLIKGNVYNYLLEVEEIFYTSLEDKSSLKVFYNKEPKLLIRRIINRQDRLSVGYTEKKMVFKKDINPFIITNPNFHPKFLLALMASKFISFVYLNISSIASKDDFRQTTLAELREIPIPIVNENVQKSFIEKANKILEIKSKDLEDTTMFEKEIDKMVYKLYNLTEEEIKIIEQK